MYVSITGNKGNQDVYIKQSYRKDNGKTSSRIYKKLGKYNDLLAQFSGDETAMMDWAKSDLCKDPFPFQQTRQLLLLPVPSGTAKVFPAESLPLPFRSRRRIGLHSGRALPELQLCPST